MCFKITSNKPNAAVKAYKIVTEDRTPGTRTGLSYGFTYADRNKVPAIRQPDTNFIRRIGSESQAGIYVYLDKRQARAQLEYEGKSGTVLIEVTVNPADFIAEGVILAVRYSRNRDTYRGVRLKVATYKYITVVGEVK